MPLLGFLIPEVFEVRRYAEIAAAHKCDHVLKIVPLLSSHANLPVLELALNFEILALDRENDLLGLIAFEALLNFQFLPRMAQG